MFAGTFAPRGWMLCNGQLLPIQRYSALFSILGTNFGGNGTTTFALPDLQGRAPVGAGAGLGLTPVDLGEEEGTSSVTLATTEMPAHTHTPKCASTPGSVGTPEAAYWAANVVSGDGTVLDSSYDTAAPNATMNPLAIQMAGGTLPHENTQPALALNYMIAIEGIFPSRN